MEKIIISFIYLAYGLFCVGQTYKIDLSKAIIKEIPVSDVLDDMKTIDIRIPDTLKLWYGIAELTNDRKSLIVSNPNEGPYLFDIEGNFIKTLEPRSADSKGFKNKIRNTRFDVKRNIFYEDVFDSWIGIDIQTNKIVKRIIKPIEYKMAPADFIQLSDNEYIGYSNDTIESGITQLVVFDSCGQVLHTVGYPESYAYVGFQYPNSPFYENGSHSYFVGPYKGKTVYEIKENRLAPYICFQANNGKFTLDKLFYVVETEERIYFSTASYWGYYDKKEDRSYLNSNFGKKVIHDQLDEKGFVPSLANGRYSVTLRKEGDILKVITGILK